MNKNLKLSMFATALASINLGVMALYEEGAVSMLGGDTAQVFTVWYLLAFLGMYQILALGREFASGGEWRS